MGKKGLRDRGRRGITFIVPCLNEEGNLIHAITAIKGALKDSPFRISAEIIIFNDFSSDNTGDMAEALKKADPSIKVVHNKRNMGFGYNFNEGARMATMDYVMMVPGDNEVPEKAVSDVISNMDKADLIIPYIANPSARPFVRRLLSRLFVIILNALFGLSLRYYNGPCLIRKGLLRQIPLKTSGFAYMASILIRLIYKGATCLQVPIDIVQRRSGRSKAIKPKVFIGVAGAVLGLFFELRFKRRGRIDRQGKAVAVDR
jgi:glycosyltransferase involved in cell wall biosynthesis